MTDNLKNDLLKKDIQCIKEDNGKFVFLMGKTYTVESSSPILVLPALFNREISVGSYLMVKVIKDSVTKIATFICCNASQHTKMPPSQASNNLFWFEITDLGFNFIRAKY